MKTEQGHVKTEQGHVFRNSKEDHMRLQLSLSGRALA
jgi:hypothetical protein